MKTALIKTVLFVVFAAANLAMWFVVAFTDDPKVKMTGFESNLLSLLLLASFIALAASPFLPLRWAAAAPGGAIVLSIVMYLFAVIQGYRRGRRQEFDQAPRSFVASNGLFLSEQRGYLYEYRAPSADAVWLARTDSSVKKDDGKALLRCREGSPLADNAYYRQFKTADGRTLFDLFDVQ